MPQSATRARIACGVLAVVVAALVAATLLGGHGHEGDAPIPAMQQRAAVDRTQVPVPELWVPPPPPDAGQWRLAVWVRPHDGTVAGDPTADVLRDRTPPEGAVAVA